MPEYGVGGRGILRSVEDDEALELLDGRIEGGVGCAVCRVECLEAMLIAVAFTEKRSIEVEDRGMDPDAEKGE